MKPHAAPHRTLPAVPGQLIGRESELADLCGKISKGDERLITLTGVGGSGKTRLALAAAEALLSKFDDAVVFVDLAPIRDPALVIATIAQVLNVRQTAEAPLLELVVRCLDDQRILLVLDNFEHVLPAAPHLAVLLADCPSLQLLVTSRAPLHLRWETEFPVPPLAVPRFQESVDLSEVAAVPAVMLFVQRAQAVRPEFQLSSDNAPTVAEICVRLDGLPLALELAAARCKALSMRELSGRLGHRLDVLSHGASDFAPRQQTLRAAIDWSYNLLSPSAQMLFRRMGVAVGGWTLVSVQSVCVDDDLPEDVVFEAITELVDQSLVLVEERRGETRYRLLETLREFALERLELCCELDALRQRHATWLSHMTEQIVPQFWSGAPDPIAAERLDREHDDMWAALQWLVSSGGAEPAMRLAARLRAYWYLRGQFTESRRFMEAVLAMPSAQTPSALRALLLTSAGMMANRLGDLAASKALNEQALSMARGAGDLFVTAQALTNLALDAGYYGDNELAAQYETESLALWRKLGVRFWEGMTLNNLAWRAWNRGDDATAAVLASEAVELGRLSELPQVVAYASVVLGEACAEGRDERSAREPLERALAWSHDVGDRWLVAWAHAALGRVDLWHGRPTGALAHFREALQLRRELGERVQIITSIVYFACAAAMEGRTARAIRLAGATSAWHDARGIQLTPRYRAVEQRWLPDARRSIGEKAFAAAWATGRALSYEAMIEDALRGDDEPTIVPKGGASPALSLTRREREVAELVARGLSNRDIGAELVVTEGTAAKHVENIRHKLGLTSRTQLARWILEQGTVTS